MFSKKDFTKLTDYLWEIPVTHRKAMKVPARFYATEEMLEQILNDRSLEQLVNVATLPGVEKYALAMPDIHEGYGFPIGGVAAIRVEDGVISPGGVGYDINCGVRMLRSRLDYKDIEPHLVNLTNQIQRDVPSGVGRGGELKLNDADLDQVLQKGAAWAVENGFGQKQDLEFLESGGKLENADTSFVSDKAKKRGADQVGTLGAGNHFLEIQRVAEIFDQEVAQKLGLAKDKITVMIHTGSRGLGHQICTDYVRLFDRAMAKYGIKLPDRELACAPFKSPEGQKYFNAMACGANFAWANRQMIMHHVRNAWQQILKPLNLETHLDVVYDVAHNIAKVEKHFVPQTDADKNADSRGQEKEFVVHRKGATRCFAPGHAELAELYQQTGQPVIIPGSMGTSSYVLVGTQGAMKQTFGSTCHGAGRAMSRHQAMKTLNYDQLKNKLEKEMGIIIRAGSRKGLLEEAPQAYKDVNQVIEVVHGAGIAKKVVKLKPLAVIKG